MASVSILGAGCAGAVSAACLSDLGNQVCVADVDADKAARIGRGQSPIVETGLDELLAAGVTAGRLTATTDVRQAVLDSEASIICVGTPSRGDGSLDLGYIRDVCTTVGEALADKPERHTVIIRSTMVPGSMRDVVRPTLEAASGKWAFEDFGLAIYPEFLREGTAIRDFYDAAITLYGVHEGDSRSLQMLRAINTGLTSREVLTSLEAAEAVKYANNCWHAVKITFANEIGNICRAAGIDGSEVMEVVCKDERLNISPAYLRPGFAFGGSCLPKDLRAIRSLARDLAVPTPLFDATLDANQLQVEKAAAMVAETGDTCIGQFGLTFKDGTDDLRESPLIALAHRLIDQGMEIKFYDSNVQQAMEKPEFRHHFETTFPRIAERFEPKAENAMQFADTVVIGRNDKQIETLIDQSIENKNVIDLVRVRQNLRSNNKYKGICW